MHTKVAVLVMLAMTLLVACGDSGSSDATAAPTRFIPTPTPRSTPLPPAPTTAPLGSEADPLQMVLIQAAPDTEQELALAALSEAFTTDIENARLAQRGLPMTVAVVAVEDASAALDAVCGDAQALAWLDAFSYYAALQNCDARAVLGVERTVTFQHLPNDVELDSGRGVSFNVVVDATLDPPPTSLEAVSGLVMCRVDTQDAISWVYPVLALQAAGINPFSDLGAIVEVEDYQTLLETVATPVLDGGCDFGAIPDGTFGLLLEAASEENATLAEEQFELLRNAWPVIPHTILVAPSAEVLPEDLLEAFVMRFETLQENDGLDDLALLLDYDTIISIDNRDLRSFVNWLNASGWAMGR